MQHFYKKHIFFALTKEKTRTNVLVGGGGEVDNLRQYMKKK